MPLAIVLKEEQFLLATARGVLRSDEVLALQSAADVLRYSHDEARRLKLQADDDRAELEARLREEARVRVEEEVARAVADVHVKGANLMREVEQAVAEAVVEALMRVAAGIDRGAILTKSLEEVRKLVDARQIAVLKVAPSDVSLANESVARLVDSAQLPATFAVRADPSVAPGECVLQSAGGRYKFGLTQQIGALADSVNAWLRASQAAAAQAAAVQAQAAVAMAASRVAITSDDADVGHHADDVGVGHHE